MSLLTTYPQPHPSPQSHPLSHPQPKPDPQPRRDDRPPLRLVEPASAPRKRVRVGVVGTVAFLLLIVGVFALAAVHTMVVQAQFELDRVDQQVAERRGELDALRLQVAQLESPGSVAAAASEIGLVTPQQRVYLEPVINAPSSGGSDVVDSTPGRDPDLAAGSRASTP